MAGLCWMVVAVAFSLSIGNSMAVGLDRLTQIMKEIKNRYFIPNMQFSLAANIPVDQNQLKNAFNADDPDVVEDTVKSGEVYEGTNVVEATFKRVELPGRVYTDHAEYRVLEKIHDLATRSEGNILIFYSYLSPCGAKCASKTHPYSILKKLKDTIDGAKWNDRAFVFSKVFDGKTIDEKDIKGSLENLGESVGQNNTFRCYTSNKRCIKCFIDGKLAAECFKN
ncbi:uncharacterized protein si:dkey-96g2.1 [Sebastes umbrosus]|uniref:uncharacterized protein si:dkey-96g2.1 n=1 Tax=Sebastes umbrosus TaxID=72105 RepID=UPI00189F754C|nr:uncharacterized protein si:dkey-96g2.1 [Sebastes umbrosus]